MIGGYVKEWAPKWGEAGRHLSILNLTEGYLKSSLPDSYKDGRVKKVRDWAQKVAALVDGKDWMIEVIRTNTLLTRASYVPHHSISDLNLGMTLVRTRCE